MRYVYKKFMTVFGPINKTILYIQILKYAKDENNIDKGRFDFIWGEKGKTSQRQWGLTWDMNLLHSFTYWGRTWWEFWTKMPLGWTRFSFSWSAIKIPWQHRKVAKIGNKGFQCNRQFEKDAPHPRLPRLAAVHISRVSGSLCLFSVWRDSCIDKVELW